MKSIKKYVLMAMLLGVVGCEVIAAMGRDEEEAHEARRILEASDYMLEAAREGDVAGLNDALRRGADVSMRDVGGESALHYLQNGEIASILIAHKADVNAKNGQRMTPLHNALSVEVVKELIEANALLDEIDIGGDTPLLVHTGNALNGNGVYKDAAGALLAAKANVEARTRWSQMSALEMLINGIENDHVQNGSYELVLKPLISMLVGAGTPVTRRHQRRGLEEVWKFVEQECREHALQCQQQDEGMGLVAGEEEVKGGE